LIERNGRTPPSTRHWRNAAAAAVTAATLLGAPTSRADEWRDAKDALSRKGISPSLAYIGDVAATVSGGARRGAVYVGNLHLQLALDGATLLGLPGVTGFLDGLDIEGSQPSNLSGDAQGISNIAGPAGFKLYEAWLQYNFLDARASALAGLYDLNTEFYRLRSASLFLNSSFGIGPEFAQSGAAGPSIFPDTSVGLRLAYKPAPDVVFRAAALDGVPLDRPGGGSGIFARGDGVLLVGEAAFLDRPRPGKESKRSALGIGRASNLPPYDNKFAIGVWHYTAKFSDLSATAPNGTAAQHRGSNGAYAILERLLFQTQADPGWRVNGFLQAGIGDDRVDRFGSYVGAGLTATGLVPGRPDDMMGAAVAAARNSSHYIDEQTQQGARVAGAEIALELSYLAPINDWLAVQPDLQYVVHPNTDPTLKNALVLQFQCTLSF